MPFDLINALASFQDYINEVLRTYLDDFCIVFIDDILIYSKTPEEHVEHVRKVLKKLLEHDLYVKLEKCQFHIQEIEFLDYILSSDDISISKERIAMILDWLISKSIHNIQVFLKFTNFSDISLRVTSE